MILNNNELAAVKDCLKRYIEFNNNGVMSSYKVKKSSLLLNDSFKTKKEKKRINYYINKLNEFERLLND